MVAISCIVGSFADNLDVIKAKVYHDETEDCDWNCLQNIDLQKISNQND